MGFQNTSFLALFRISFRADIMAQLPTSGIRLFKVFGIQVYLHWSWIIVALIEIRQRNNAYSSIAWNIAEYLALFAIVLMHEFGHALAARSVGGVADRIMLWPLGGVAFASPPPRPGATLWTIAAGPLVNVVLVPITIGLAIGTGALGLWLNQQPVSSLQQFTIILAGINLLLLIFNMLPIYPLDGGQILRAILWFFLGQGRSLTVASVIGMAGSAIGIALALWVKDIWLIVIAGFAAMQCWGAFKHSKLIRLATEAPRRQDVRCPHCGAPPPIGPLWTCPCGQVFDTFATQGRCPRCGGLFMTTTCPACRRPSPPLAWQISPPPLPATSGTN